MTEWSRKMAEIVRRRDGRQELRDAKFVERQRRRREMGPILWEEIIHHIDTEAEALNKDMGNTIVTRGEYANNELTLTANLEDGVRRSTARFSADTGRVMWNNDRGIFDKVELVIGNDGEMAFCIDRVPSTPESIAKRILENLLD